jgi:hypothetical protein
MFCGKLVTFAAARLGGREMTDPKENQEDREELDLDEQTVRDLDPDESDSEEVKGGRAGECASINCPPYS